MKPNPQPQRPSYENMGTRLYETGTTSNADLKAFMDPDRIHYEQPSTHDQVPSTQQQPDPEPHIRRVRRGRACGTHGHLQVPGRRE